MVSAGGGSFERINTVRIQRGDRFDADLGWMNEDDGWEEEFFGPAYFYDSAKEENSAYWP